MSELDPCESLDEFLMRKACELQKENKRLRQAVDVLREGLKSYACPTSGLGYHAQQALTKADELLEDM